MRVVISKRLSFRGEGLGNELFAWAKGWLASEALGALHFGPAWGINPRRYYRNFGTSRADFILEELGKLLPHHSFTENDYRKSGHVHFGDAVLHWADQTGLLGRRHYIVTVDGMYGGYPAIEQARNFLKQKLLSSRGCLHNLYRTQLGFDPGKLSVVVHIRAGAGFRQVQSGDDLRGRFNIAIPHEWYLHVCTCLKEEFAGRIQFHFVSNTDGPEFRALVHRFNPDQRSAADLSECSDLLIMSQADLLVCSVSSYSLAAAFLSQGPYLWYEPQLHLEDGIYSLWQDEKAQLDYNSLSSQSHRAVRETYQCKTGIGRGASRSLHLGTAMNEHQSLPMDLVHCLNERLRCLDSNNNLLSYGSLPDTLCSRTAESP